MIKVRKVLIVLFFAIFTLSLSASLLFGSAQVQADVTAVVMDEKGEVRYDLEKTGLRFTAYVSEDYFTGGKINADAIAGVVIVDGEVDDVTKITHASNGTGGEFEGRVLDVVATVWDAARDNDSGKAFNAVVYDIPATAYGLTLTARGYVGILNTAEVKEEYDYTDYNFVYSDNVCSRSVAQVSSCALANGFEDTLGILTEFVDGVHADITVNNESSESYEFNYSVGQSLNVAITEPDLTIKYEKSSNSVDISEDGKITVVRCQGASENATVTASIGSLSKTITINIANSFKDGDIADGVLADFDERYYIDYGIISRPSGGHTYMVMQHLAAGNEEIPAGANGGVVKIRQYSNYDMVEIPFSETITSASITGIYIRVWVNATTAAANSAYLTINGTEKKVTNSDNYGYNLIADSWNNIYVPSGQLTVATGTGGYNTASFSAIKFYFFGSAGHYWFIDEVGVLEHITNADANELNDFNDAADANLCNGRFVRVTQLMPEDEGYPTGCGATTGIAVLPQAGDGNPSIFYFKQSINTSNVSKIVLRMYVPTSAGDHRFRVWITPQGGARTEITAAAAPLKAPRGTFADVVIDLSKLGDGKEVTFFEIARQWSVNNTTSSPYYIDSITFVAK